MAVLIEQQDSRCGRGSRGLPAGAELPGRIGPVEFEQFGAKWVAVRCPSEFEGLMRKLQRATDPLFRQARMTLDGEGEAP